MITEDYVSFETAKLLKEKGFDADIDLWYNSDGEIFHLYHYDYNATKYFACVQCPTLQMVMKWLREVYNLVICPEIGNENDKGNTDYYNPDRWWWFFDITNEKGVVIDAESDFILNEYSSYEEACEAAINYCLKNLI